MCNVPSPSIDILRFFLDPLPSASSAGMNGSLLSNHSLLISSVMYASTSSCSPLAAAILCAINNTSSVGAGPAEGCCSAMVLDSPFLGMENEGGGRRRTTSLRRLVMRGISSWVKSETAEGKPSGAADNEIKGIRSERVCFEWKRGPRRPEPGRCRRTFL